MKNLFELAVKAHFDGSNFFGEQPLPYDQERVRLTFHPVLVEAEYFDDYGRTVKGKEYYSIHFPCSGIHHGEKYTCGTGVGIYPYADNTRIYLFSGHRVFDVEITPELQAELNLATVDTFGM